MEYILAILIILIFVTSIFCNIWTTKVNRKRSEMIACAIYMLYKELKRYNDNNFWKSEVLENE